jgi:phosphoglycolate phosphatase
MALSAVIFDLDGTLVDTAPDLHAATNHVLSTLKRRPISVEQVRAFVGHGARALITRGPAILLILVPSRRSTRNS